MIEKILTHLLKEDIVPNNEEQIDVNNPEDAEQEFVNDIDDGVNPEEYDVNPGEFKQIARENIEEAKKWIKILEDFSSLINDAENMDSLNHFLNRVDREGSPFRGIVRSQGKRVASIAENCEALAQQLNSYVISSDKKVRELVQSFPNLKK